MKDQKAINMNIDAEVWTKVGFLAAVENTTKREIVEKAVELYFKENKPKF